MSDIQLQQGTSLDAKNTGEVVEALSNSLYAGAKRESVYMVLNYCQVVKLDPFMKPVHIVPMNVKNPTTGRYEFRDVVMPGINLYRIQAARSGKYAGMSEPEFGPNKKFKLTTGETIEYPEYCKVTVKRIENDRKCEFSAKEFWLENYATKGKDSKDPNAMWKKRPFAQLAKCAEAQALRKGFPEICPAVTAEEMEGKTMEVEDTHAYVQSNGQAKKAPLPASKTQEAIQLLKANSTSPRTLQLELVEKIMHNKIPDTTVKKWRDKAGVDSITDLNDEDAKKCIEWIEKNN